MIYKKEVISVLIGSRMNHLNDVIDCFDVIFEWNKTNNEGWRWFLVPVRWNNTASASHYKKINSDNVEKSTILIKTFQEHNKNRVLTFYVSADIDSEKANLVINLFKEKGYIVGVDDSTDFRQAFLNDIGFKEEESASKNKRLKPEKRLVTNRKKDAILYFSFVVSGFFIFF